MQTVKFDILQSVAKQRNTNLPQEKLREGMIHRAEFTNYQRFQPLVNKIIIMIIIII